MQRNSADQAQHQAELLHKAAEIVGRFEKDLAMQRDAVDDLMKQGIIDSQGQVQLPAQERAAEPNS